VAEKPKAEPVRKADGPKPKPSAYRPDLATIGGGVLALLGIIGGLLLEKGSLGDIAQATAALIVFGGTLGAVMITNPMPVVLRAGRALRAVVFEPAQAFGATIDELIVYAGKARKNGIVSLETEAADAPNPFLKKALNLAVDGTDLQELRNMMELEIQLSEQRYEAEAKVWESAGGYSPTIGIIGAVMGLIQVMKHLENIKEVGHGIAVAFVATVYGVGAANIFFLPAASKLRTRAREAVMLQELILEGVIGIVEGLNPKLIRIKLEAFTEPEPARKKSAAKKGAAPAAAGGKGGPVAA
jgi:chemotaxis protein MotA